jgi:hypothetical protein
LTPPKCARDAHFALAEMHIMDLQNAHFEQFALLKLPSGPFLLTTQIFVVIRSHA